MSTLSTRSEGDEAAAAPPRERFVVLGAAAGGIGGALTAAFSALCCVGPASVALLGAGGALAAAELKPYRPIILLVSLALLGFGFYRAYGTRIMREGHACPIKVGRVAQIILWLSAAIWVAAAVLPTG